MIGFAREPLDVVSASGKNCHAAARVCRFRPRKDVVRRSALESFLLPGNPHRRSCMSREFQPVKPVCLLLIGLCAFTQAGWAQSFTQYPIPTPSSGALGITAGSDGALWFTESNVDKIGRITIAGVITEYPVP